MKEITQMGDWEYLGTVVQNGIEFIALQPLDGTSRVCFFLCDAGNYRRVVDENTERIVARQFHWVEIENERNREKEVR